MKKIMMIVAATMFLGAAHAAESPTSQPDRAHDWRAIQEYIQTAQAGPNTLQCIDRCQSNYTACQQQAYSPDKAQQCYRELESCNRRCGY